jgi:glycosyltransferase involved in cell wall biosynthesis
MRILFLPVNVASMQPITAHAMNQIEGIEAKCIVDQNNLLATVNDTVISIPRTSKLRLWKSIYYGLTYFNKIKKWIEWADVLHYVYTPGDKFHRDLSYANKLGKKIFIEFVGSDIRIPELLSEFNPYYRNVYYNENYEYKQVEGPNKELKLQKLFADHGAIPIVNPEMQIFVNKDLFPKSHQIYFRINVNDFVPSYPQIENKRPIIVHSPSALYAKGSNIILPMIERLQKSYDFEFIMIHKKPRAEVLEIIQKADIFIDQIILGTYAMAAMEAMAYGKPTLCYIMPEVFKNGLVADIPVVNVNPDTIEEKLIELILNPQMRNEIGKKSRAYVLKHHDDQKIAHQLIEIYNS